MHSYVKWEGEKSEFFDALSGCPEGSKLRLNFFSIVIDNL